jgi:hypothetical protein
MIPDDMFWASVFEAEREFESEEENVPLFCQQDIRPRGCPPVAAAAKRGGKGSRKWNPMGFMRREET